MLSARVDVIDIAPLLLVQRSVTFIARRSEKPRTALSGVRSSWLMVERNWSLNLLVRSASSFARVSVSWRAFAG